MYKLLIDQYADPLTEFSDIVLSPKRLQPPRCVLTIR